MIRRPSDRSEIAVPARESSLTRSIWSWMLTRIEMEAEPNPEIQKTLLDVLGRVKRMGADEMELDGRRPLLV